MNTPANLLTLETGGGYEIQDERFYEHENAQSEEIVIISGTLTVSP